MAVTKLKMINISGGIKDFVNALYMCINDPFLHIEDAPSIIKGINGIITINENNPYKDLLVSTESLATLSDVSLAGKLKTYENVDTHLQESEGSKARQLIDEALDLNTDEAKFIIKSQTDKLRSGLDAIKEENNKINELRRILEQLDHIGNITANLSDLFRFEFFKFRFGHMPKEAYDSIHLYTNDSDDFFFIPSSIQKNEVWGIYFTPQTKSLRIDSLFKTLHFERVRISDQAHGTPEEARAEIEKEIAESVTRIEKYESDLAAINAGIAPIIDQYYEKIYLLANMFDLRRKAVRTATSFHLIAWLPETHVETFIAKLQQLSTVVSPVNSPAEMPIVKPPTLLKNNILFRPFEQFVHMYGLPAYNEIDPTPFVALTYILFFGIMFGDLGQGFIISVLGFFLWFKKRINLARIAGILGISSMFFGVLFGSVFGLEGIIHGYNPLEHINTVLLAAVGLGMVTITGAIIINIINGTKQKNYEKIFFSQNGIAGLVFYWSVIIAALIIMEFVPIKISATIFIVLIVICLVIIYLREPLANIVSKKPHIIPHNAGEFFIVNLFELFEIVLSFLTNTISFIRVGAFALNHVGMMSVVTLLATTVNGGTNPVVLVIGNIIVIALEGLIVGIQCLRLEYYEIFSRFFDGSGRKFEHSGLNTNKILKRK